MSAGEGLNVLRPSERIEDYAVVMAHANALGGTAAALVALGVSPAEWSRAAHWSSALTREALTGRTELATAFGSTFAAETAAIAARAEASAEAAAVVAKPVADEAAPGGPTVLDASNAAAREIVSSRPPPPLAAPWPAPPRPSFVSAAVVAAPASGDPDGTMPFNVEALEASAPVLPFNVAAPPTPQASQHPGPVEELTDVDLVDEPTMDAIDASTTLDALPFASAADDDAPTTPFRALPPLDDARPLPMPLDRYASLCASLDVAAGDEATVLDRFNVAGREHLEAIHAAFRGLFGRDAQTHATFRAWRADFVARLRSRG